MLTNAAVKAAAPAARAYKISDAGGLYLHVAPTGRRTWRMKFRFGGVEKLLTFGAWPEMSLVDARERREEAKRQLRQRVDPSGTRARAEAARQAEAEAETFESVARAWWQHQRRRWGDLHAADVIASLERDVFAEIGGNSLASIDPPAVLRVLRAVERRGCVETARRLRQRISAVFAFAMSEGRASADPAAIVRKALAPADLVRRHPALTELDDVRALLAAVESGPGDPMAKLASRFLALTGVRLSAIREATWAQIEGIGRERNSSALGMSSGEATLSAVWRVPARHMKLIKAKKADSANDHLVPLSPQAVAVLIAARELNRPNIGDVIFAGSRGGRLGEKAIGDLYKRTRFAGRHVPHGWRASFSTIMNEHAPGDRAAIDQALAHVPKDKVEAAYNRAERLDKRRQLFDAWGSMLIDP